MFRQLLILSVTLMALQPVFSQAEDSSAFVKGIEAFRKGSYDDAVFYFKKAKESGVTGSNIEFNLAVSYYKLEKYELAKEGFLMAAKQEKYRQLAYYNLGLVADKQNNTNEAIRWYQKASALRSDSKIASLAKSKISKLSLTDKAPPQQNLLAARDKYKTSSATGRSGRERKINGGVTLAVGNDDNILLADGNAEEGQASNLDGNYWEVFGYLNIPLGQNWTLNANTYWQDYDIDPDTQDFNNVSIGIKYRTQLGGWWFSPSVHYVDSNLGSNDYQQIWDYKLRFSRSLGHGRWMIFRYRYSDIESEAPYQSFTGDRHQFRVEYKTKLAFGKLRLRYELETNDRQNRPTSNSSPTRHTIRARLKRPLSDRWNLATEVGFRTSDYDTPSALTQARQDDRFRFRLDINRDMSKTWKLGVLYVYTDNDSNGANGVSYSYTKNDIQFYSSWTF